MQIYNAFYRAQPQPSVIESWPIYTESSGKIGGLRGFILQKVQASVVERQEKKFFYPTLSFEKEDTLITILSA
jgi:hypothetical protein